MDVRVIYRDCPTCGRRFGQPDDPGRKRRFCSDACKQAAYRARKYAREQAHQRAQDDARRRQREEQARRARDRSRHDQAAHDRARHRSDGLHAKAASTGFPEEADACRGQGRAAPRQVRPVEDDGRIVTRPSTEQGERYGSYAHPSGMPTPRW